MENIAGEVFSIKKQGNKITDIIASESAGMYLKKVNM